MIQLNKILYQNIIKFFHLEDFKKIIVIFTLHFGDLEGDDVDKMKESRDKSNGEIFESVMNKVKEVSDQSVI